MIAFSALEDCSHCVHFVHGECSLLVVKNRLSLRYSFTARIYLSRGSEGEKTDSSLPVKIHQSIILENLSELRGRLLKSCQMELSNITDLQCWQMQKFQGKCIFIMKAS